MEQRRGANYRRNPGRITARKSAMSKELDITGNYPDGQEFSFPTADVQFSFPDVAAAAKPKEEDDDEEAEAGATKAPAAPAPDAEARKAAAVAEAVATIRDELAAANLKPAVADFVAWCKGSNLDPATMQPGQMYTATLMYKAMNPNAAPFNAEDVPQASAAAKFVAWADAQDIDAGAMDSQTLDQTKQRYATICAGADISFSNDEIEYTGIPSDGRFTLAQAAELIGCKTSELFAIPDVPEDLKITAADLGSIAKDVFRRQYLKEHRAKLPLSQFGF
jgi:hypothetical protein